MSAADLGAVVAALSARVAMTEARLDALETPSQDRAAHGLAELADQIDTENPDRVPGNAVAELEARKKSRN